MTGIRHGGSVILQFGFDVVGVKTASDLLRPVVSNYYFSV